MSRTSGNVYTTEGALWHGFDYDMQVWVEDGIVLACGHPSDMVCGCNGRKFAGRLLACARIDWSKDLKEKECESVVTS